MKLVFLISFLLVGFAVANAPDDETGCKDTKKWELIDEGILSYGNKKQINPAFFEICLMGNGIEDELRVKVNPEDEKIQLTKKKNEYKIIFMLQKYNFAAMTRVSEPGTLIVIQNGKCTRGIYKQGFPKQKLFEEGIGSDHCYELMKEVGLPTQVGFPGAKVPNLLGPYCDPTKWKLDNSGFITFGIRKDIKATNKPDTFDICVMGNGVEDELHVKLNSKEEKNQLIIKIYHDIIIFSLPTANFLAASDKNLPGTMMVIENGKCTLRSYYYSDAGIQPNYEDLYEDACMGVQNKMNYILAIKETASAAEVNPENKVTDGSKEDPSESEFTDNYKGDFIPLKWALQNTGLFTFGLVEPHMDKADILEIYVAGNGIEDVLRQNVNSKDEKKDLRIRLFPNGIIFSLPTHGFAAISEETKPNTMIVVTNNICKRRRYDPQDPRHRLSDEEVGKTECEAVKNKITGILAHENKVESADANAGPITSEILYKKEPNDKLEKWPLRRRDGIYYGVVLEHKEHNFILGMYIKGNGIEDELHVELNTVLEMKELHITNRKGRITFTLPNHNFAAVSSDTERGVLTVVKNGHCIQRRYDPYEQRKVLAKEVVSREICDDIMRQLGLNYNYEEVANKASSDSESSEATDKDKKEKKITWRNWISLKIRKLGNFLKFWKKRK